VGPAPELGEDERRRRIDDALASAAGPAPSALARSAPLWLAASAAALAIATAAWALSSAQGERPSAPEAPAQSTVADKNPSPEDPEQPTTPRQLVAGRAVELAADAEPVEHGPWRVEPQRATTFVPAELEGTRTQLTMGAGEARFTLDPDAAHELIVRTPTRSIEVLGTVFTVEVGDAGTRVEVERVRVRVRDLEQDTYVVLGAGEHVDAGSLTRVRAVSARADVVEDASTDGPAGEAAKEQVAKVAPRRTKRPTPDAGALLAEAREARAAKNWKASARAYEALLEHHPSSGAARASQMSLGVLYLEQLGAPMRALPLFEDYLEHAPTGALRQEAHLGRVRALRTLGLAKAEAHAIDALLAEHPDVVDARRLELRRNALRDE